jgi:hypothetical protein
MNEWPEGFSKVVIEAKEKLDGEAQKWQEALRAKEKELEEQRRELEELTKKREATFEARLKELEVEMKKQMEDFVVKEKELEALSEAREEAVRRGMDTQKNKIKLNVGGKLFITSTTTLQRERHSMLACIGSDRWKPSEDDGAFFIDRDPRAFECILEYLRTGQLPTNLSERRVTMEQVCEEARFYLLNVLVDKLENGSDMTRDEAMQMVERKERGIICSIDLTRKNLSGVNLAGVRLDGATLDLADLSNANLKNASLEGCSLIGANLSGADLTSANLNGTRLVSSESGKSCDFTGAKLQSVKLVDAKMEPGTITGIRVFRTDKHSLDSSRTCIRGPGWSMACIDCTWQLPSLMNIWTDLSL